MLEPSKQLNNGVKGMYGRWPNDESNHPFAIHRAKRGSPSRRAWPLWPVPNWRKVANQKSVSRGEPSLRDYIFFYPPPLPPSYARLAGRRRSPDLSSPRPRKSPLGFDIRRVVEPAKNWPSEFRGEGEGVVYRRRGWQKGRPRRRAFSKPSYVQRTVFSICREKGE